MRKAHIATRPQTMPASPQTTAIYRVGCGAQTIKHKTPEDREAIQEERDALKHGRDTGKASRGSRRRPRHTRNNNNRQERDPRCTRKPPNVQLLMMNVKTPVRTYLIVATLCGACSEERSRQTPLGANICATSASKGITPRGRQSAARQSKCKLDQALARTIDGQTESSKRASIRGLAC